MDHLTISRCTAESEYISCHRSVVLTLELEVVDRKHRLDAIVDLFSSEQFSELHRDKRCMPVVAVKNIRSKVSADVTDGLKNSY